MDIQIHGAAGTVTGSKHLVRGPDATVLLDCGLYQGRRRESFVRNSELPFSPRELSAVVLSHAHIDHSGLIPMLHKKGYRGKVYCTPATRDLCEAMLMDAASIQEADARYLNKKAWQRGQEEMLIEPLYTTEDAERALELLAPVEYHHRKHIAPGVEVELHDAGHVLGSAIVALDVDDVGERRRIIFSGDLGRRDMPILRDPEVPGGAQLLLLESTYGDRLHGPIERTDDELAEAVATTYERGGKVLIPSFALERAQEVIFALKRLRMQKRMPAIPVYVDSPLTVRVTDVFRRHPEAYDAEAKALIDAADSPFDFEDLHFIRSVEDSKAITRSRDPMVIISASGMCESGRIVHHLKAMVGDPRHSIVIVGWQAQHTLGRRLVEGRQRVRVLGVERERRAQVVVLNGFSAHADADDLVGFAEALRERGPLRRIALVHGEPAAQEVLKERLEGLGFPDVRIPALGDLVPV